MRKKNMCVIICGQTKLNPVAVDDRYNVVNMSNIYVIRLIYFGNLIRLVVFVLNSDLKKFSCV